MHLATVTTSVQSGDQVTNTTTDTSFATKLAMPPTGVNDNRFGQSYRVTCFGYLSTDATPGTLTLRVKHNNNGTRFTLGATSAFTPPAGLSNAPFKFEGVASYATTGSSGIAVCQGTLTITKSDGSVFSVGMIATGTGTSGWATGVSTATNSAQYLEVAAQWGSALATDIITAAMLVFERIT